MRNVILVDISSSGLTYYLAKNTKVNAHDLAAINFSDLTLLKDVAVNVRQSFCQENLLADDDRLKQLLHMHFASFTVDQYAIVFLVTPGFTQLEKSLLKSCAPVFKEVLIIPRHYFYNLYLLQKRNFSPGKLIIALFNDCVELSFFHGVEVFAHERVPWRNLSFSIQHFWAMVASQFPKIKTDCFYLFTHAAHPRHLYEVGSLAKSLQLEAVEVGSLC